MHPSRAHDRRIMMTRSIFGGAANMSEVEPITM